MPSGAFGGSDDWALSPDGAAVAVSARPPLATDEAWTTNRHIYLQRSMPDGGGAWGSDAPTELSRPLGECLTEANPGYDTHPVWSPDGSKLAWLTMAGGDYESDAVGIRVYDMASGETSDLLEAETDFAHSPGSLHWYKAGPHTVCTTTPCNCAQRVSLRLKVCTVCDAGPRTARVCSSALTCAPWSHMVHPHTVHLSPGALLTPCTMCDTGALARRPLLHRRRRRRARGRRHDPGRRR